MSFFTDTFRHQHSIFTYFASTRAIGNISFKNVMFIAFQVIMELGERQIDLKNVTELWIIYFSCNTVK